MKETCEFFAEKYNVKFYYEDFRPGWQEGIDISKELELYRQPYCGCIFSEEERYSKAIRKARKKAAKEKKRLALEKAEQERKKQEELEKSDGSEIIAASETCEFSRQKGNEYE